MAAPNKSSLTRKTCELLTPKSVIPPITYVHDSTKPGTPHLTHAHGIMTESLMSEYHSVGRQQDVLFNGYGA